ncbi:hypothetical protein LguiA_014037 [Lonicera macranthoides]
MDTFNFDNVMVEKANAMLCYNRLNNLTKLFRLGEICFLLLFLSWTSTRLPFAVKTSGYYLRQLISFIISPFFIFLLSNAIVITLLFKSGLSNNAEPDLYEEFVENTEIGASFIDPVEIVYEDKHITSELNNSTPVKGFCEVDKQNICELNDSTRMKSECEVALIDESVADLKSYGRSQSVNLNIESDEKVNGKLRRSQTEIRRKIRDSGECPVKKVEVVDKLSNEDFQRTIEAFIAKQVKFHKEEKLAIVPATTSTSST